MGRLFGRGLGALCLVLCCGTLGCSSGSPTTPGDSGTDRSLPKDVRVDSEPDSSPTDTAAGMDAAVDERPKTDIRLILSEKTVKLTEGSTALTGTFTVTLNQTSPSPFIVTVLTGNPNVATVVPETLEFAANEIGPKEVTVIPTTDDDTVDNSTVVTLSSPETGSASISVDVKDSDVQSLIVPPSVGMTEGRTEPLSVRLFKRPASSVVVTLTSSNPSKLSVGTTTMTFNAANYSIPQTATLTAAQDDDTNLDNVTVNLTATGNVGAAAVAVEITDDDAVNMDISPANLTVMERGPTPGTITVRLTRPPSADVTVAVASSNVMRATVSPPTLIFTAASYATAQTVQVSPVPDDDSRDEMVNVTFSATGISPTPPMRTVAVLVDDPDSQALQVTPTMVSVKEGETVTFDVRLTLNPGASSTVAVFSQNPAKVEVSPPVLTFTTSNFSTPQTVTVKSLNDDDLANDSVMLTLTGSAADNVNVPVAVTDDDTQKIQLIGPSPGSDLVMQETRLNGPASTSQFGVRLAYRPPTAVTVLLTSGNGSKLELSRSTLTFTPSEYGTVQFVTVSAPHDNDMVDDRVEVSATATSPGPTIPLAKLNVEIRDLDVLAFYLSKSVLTAPKEGGTTYDKRPGGPNTPEEAETFKITLTVIPEREVTTIIEASPEQAGKVEISPATCVLGGQSSLTAGCDISVRAREDQDARDEVVTLTIRDLTGVLASAKVNVTIDDRDVQSLLVTSATGGAVDDPIKIPEGTSADIKVALTAEPTESTSIQLTTSLAGQVAFTTTAPCAVTAGGVLSTSATWQVGCVVTIVAPKDEDLLDQNLSLRASAGGLGVADVFVNVRKVDNNVQELVFTDCTSNPTHVDIARKTIALDEPAGGATTGAGAVSLCVKLMFQPEVTNTVTLTPSQMPLPLGLTAPNFTVLSEAGSPTLTFNNTSNGTGSYNTLQRIVVTPIADQNIDSENHQGSNTWDSQFTVSVTPFANPQVFTVNVVDHDQQSFLFYAPATSVATTTPPTLDLEERMQSPSLTGAQTFGIRLARIPGKMQTNDPGSSETITITPRSNTVTVTGDCPSVPTATSLTFTNANWDMRQNVIVTVCPDADTKSATAVLDIQSSKSPGASQTVTVVVTDRDLPYGVAVTVVGDGGSVSSSTTPADAKNHEIAGCREGSSSAACNGVFEPQSAVHLTETPDTNWTFGGWSCAPVSGSPITSSASSSLTVNMLGKPYQCTATFKPQLQITVVGSGRVDTLSPSSGIGDCRSSGGDCDESYEVGTPVKLTVSANSGWEFSGWSDCVTTPPAVTDNPLTVTMSGPKSCKATFAAIVTP